MTRMTLLQVRAIAQVELGYFRPAEKDLQTIESLVELYPHGNPGFYAEATLIRLLGKSGRSGMAQTRLSHLWRRFSNEVPTVDHLLTLFRAELHLQGYRAKNALELAIGSYLLATAMGDRLYSGLAWLDVTRCFAALDDRSSRILEDWAHAYERVADARDSEPEARGTLPASHFAGVHAKIARAESLFIPEPGLSICLKKNMVAHRSLQPQVAAGFCALADAQLQMLSKEVLFKHIWTGQRFSSQLHDPILRTLLKRMRSQSGADLKTVRGHIESGSVWVVRHFN